MAGFVSQGQLTIRIRECSTSDALKGWEIKCIIVNASCIALVPGNCQVQFVPPIEKKKDAHMLLC